MRIQATKEKNMICLTIAGVVGMFELKHAVELDAEIKKTVEKNLKDIAVDFSKVSVMNSAAISRLIGIIRYIQTVNGRLAFWGLNKDLLDILNFVNIPNFAVANSREGASELFM